MLEAANVLATTKGALDERFPRQRDYVAAFFLDVTPARAKGGGGETGGGETAG